MKILGDQIRNNPDRVLSNMPKVNARLETGQFAFPFVSYCYSFSTSYNKKKKILLITRINAFSFKQFVRVLSPMISRNRENVISRPLTHSLVSNIGV
jgi:hypothetical protein